MRRDEIPRVDLTHHHMFFPLPCRILAVFMMAAVLFTLSGNTLALPYPVVSGTDLRADYRSDWSAFSSIHGTILPDFTTVPTTVAGQNLQAHGQNGTLSIWNALGRRQPGVLLDMSGTGTVYLYPEQKIQGFGITIESTLSGPVTFHLDVSTKEQNFVSAQSITVPDGKIPTFLSLVDPQARIGIISLRTSPPGPFTLSDATVQLRRAVQTDADLLPTTADKTVAVRSTATYLNQGYGNLKAAPATEVATSENQNVHDLRAWFPTLRAGDVLALERLGSPIGTSRSANNLLGVLSSTQQLLAGTESRRVPGAIKAGVGCYTPPVIGKYNTTTSTNLPEDFIIGSRSLVIFPSSARYLFLTRASQNVSATPLSVRVSHIPRDVFGAWISDYGLVGTLADANSDLDGDGLTLLEEFAFMKDPTLADAASRADYSFAPFLDPTALTGDTLRLFFGARTDGPVRYSAEVTSDLENWQRLPDTAIVHALPDEFSPRAIFSVTDPTRGPRRFSRIIIDHLPLPTP